MWCCIGNIILESARSCDILKIDIWICQRYSWRNIWRAAVDTESESRISISFLYSKFGRIWGFHICLNWSACSNFTRNTVIRCGSGWEHKYRNMSSCIGRAYNAVWNAIFVSRDKGCFGINTVTQIWWAALISQKFRLYLSSVWGDGIWIRSKIKCCRAAVCTFFCWKNSACPWIEIKLIIKKNVGI